MPVLYANRAFSTLASGITNVATSLSVAAGQGARFPAISGGDHFYATLDDNAGNVEIVRVTARASDTFTIVRAQDGTSALAFSAGAGVELRVVRAMLDDIKTDARAGYAPLSGATFTGNVVVNTGADSRVLVQSSGTTQGQFQTTGALVRVASNNALPLALAVNGVDHVTVLSGGNVGIGTNSPAQKLSVNNSTAVNTYASFSNPNTPNGLYVGSAANGDGVVGTVDAKPLLFLAGAQERMRLDASGNLGIGTVSPVAKLDVNGGINLAIGNNLTWGGAYGAGTPTIAGSNSGGGALLFYPSGSTANERMRLDSSGLGVGTTSTTSRLTIGTGSYAAAASGTAGLYATAAQGLVVLADGFYVGSRTGSDRLILDSSGNLGLGVTPSAWNSGYRSLEIGSSLGMIGEAGAADFYLNAFLNTSGAFVYRASAPAGAYSMAAGMHRWYTAPSGTAGNAISFTQAMTLDASGNLGVGTTAPSGAAGLAFAINGGGNQTRIALKNSTTGDAAGDGFQILLDGGGVDAAIENRENGHIRFSTNSTERARITSGGDFIVGGGATVRGKITVESTFGTQVGAYHNVNTGQVFFSNSSAAAGTGWYHFNGVSGNNTVQNILIYGNGDVKNANNVFAALSDLKLKENIVDATPKLEKLMRVRVVNYNLIGGHEQHKQLGVIAQELEQVFPGLVDETPDKDSQGNDLGTTTKSVKYSVFTPMLIKAMQEQQALIAALTARVAALEAN